ncbi:MAG: glycosyltransferase [Natrinema limicola]
MEIVLTRAEGELLSAVPESVRVVELNGTTVPGPEMVSYALPLIRYLRAVRPDAVLAAQAHTNPLALFATRVAGIDAETVVCVQTMTSHQLTQRDRHHRRWTQLTRYLYRLGDTIVAVSEEVKHDAATALDIPIDKFSVIHQPTVTASLLDQSREPIDHPWFDDRAPPVVLGVGRLDPQKNFSSLITAFSRVHEIEDARLLILGEGEMRPDLERLVAQRDLESVVSMPGTKPNPYPYMRQASVFALPSRTEAVPLALIEALACECPVVSTTCSSGPIEVLENGTYGELVPVDDPAALAAAIVSTLRDPPPKSMLRERSREFSVSTIADEYERVLFPEQAPRRPAEAA